MAGPSPSRSKNIQLIDKIRPDSIRTIVDRIVEKFDPEKIILFGSYAYSKPDQSSDLDLLVILETPQEELETALLISDSLPPHAFCIDIIARSGQAINERISLRDYFIEEILKRGQILYARNH